MTHFTTTLRPLLFLFLLLLWVPGRSQEQGDGPYYLSLKRDLLYAGAAAGAVLWSDQLEANVPDILLADLELGTVPGYDRLPAGFRSKRARLWSDHTRDAAKVLPLLLLFDRRSRRDAGQLTILFAESYFLTKGITDAVKASVRRPRPYVRDDLGAADVVIRLEDRSSFISGHTSGAAVGAFSSHGYFRIIIRKVG